MPFTWTTRHAKLAVLAIIALLVGGLCWFSIVVRNADRCIVHSMLVSQVLKAYTKDHRGRLPSSLNELIETGYLRCDDQGQLRMVKDKTDTEGCFSGAGLFDIVWGTGPDDVDENGYVPARNRFLIVPTEDSPCDARWCEGTSKRVAEAMKQAANSAQSRPG